jgi:hypothetical protein
MYRNPSPAYPGIGGAPNPPINNNPQYQQFPIQQNQQHSLPGTLQQIIPDQVQQGSAHQFNAPLQYNPPLVNYPPNYNQQQPSPLVYNQPSSSFPQIYQQHQPAIQYNQPQTPFGYNYNQQPYQHQGGYVQVQQPIQRNSQQNTNNYSQSEILEIQTFFYQVAGIDRNIDRQEFVQIILLAYPNLKNLPQLHGFFENLFRQCDLNNNGFIDLKEFMIGYKRVSDQLEDMNNQCVKFLF